MLHFDFRIFRMLILLCVGALAAQAEPDSLHQPSAPSSDSLSGETVVTVDIRSRAIAVLAWPFEYVLQPVFNLAIYPLIGPLQYMNDQNLIDKGVQLISFGEKDNIFIYPTFNMKPGTESSVGAAYRHRDAFFGPDYLVLSANLFANGDWASSWRYSKQKLLGTELGIGASLGYGEDRDKSYRVLETGQSFLYADTSLALRVFVSNPLVGGWSWELNVGMDFYRMDIPDIQDSLLPDDLGFSRYQRGFYQNFDRYPVGVWLNYDSRDASQAPTEGIRFKTGITRIFVSDYSGSNSVDYLSNAASHDYFAFDLTFQHFLLLGKQRYAMTTQESRESQEQIRSMSLRKAMDLFKPEQIRQTLFERKVLVSQFRMRQMWEDEPGMAPFVGLGRLGNSFPLRAYGSGAFNDYAIMGWSNEYRWPLAKLVDGLVFNEYGLYGRSWNDLSLKNLKNSWGFGIRVRKPDLFLTRAQLAFHGLQGFAMILTVNPTY